MSTTLQPGLPLPLPDDERMVLSYAGFWWRALALSIDWVVLSLVQGAIAGATGLPMLGVSTQDAPDNAVSNVDWTTTQTYGVGPLGHHLHWHGEWLFIISTLIALAYFVLLESSRWQGTLGKRVCRIRVTDLAGRRIGILRALGRYLGKFVSGFIFFIGFMMAGWTRRKQALHDMMAGTLVMRLRPADTVFAFRPPQST